MKKECTYAFLPTEEASPIGFDEQGNIRSATEFGFPLFDTKRNFQHKPVHLYILSDDEIQEGDWSKTPYGIASIEKIKNHYNSLLVKTIKDEIVEFHKSDCKKIIATTNRKVFALMKNRFPATISQSDIEYIISLYNRKKVDVEKAAEDLALTRRNIHAYTEEYCEGVKDGYEEGYNQCLQDNTDKIKDFAYKLGGRYGIHLDKYFESHVQELIHFPAKEQPKKNTVMVFYDDAVALEGGEINPYFMKPKLDTLGNIIICK